jgi:nicotinamide riboside transporter PnuC
MSTKQPTIFGREPAAFVGLIEVVLALFLSWNLFGLTAETVSLIVAVVAAVASVYVAYVTRDTLLGGIVGLVKALAALYVGFGFDLTTNQTAAIIAVTVTLVSFFQRTQTAPAAQASFRDPDLPVAASSAAVAASEDGSGFVTGQWLDKPQPLDGA